MGRIAQDLIASLRERSPEIIRVAEQFTEGTPSDLPSPEELLREGYDPQYILYLAAQTFAVLFEDSVAELDEFEPYRQVVERAEEQYQPSAPPVSPITQSYFWTWALFDFRFGPDQETMGGCLLELMRSMQAPVDMLNALEKYNSSRLGIYEHRGQRAGKVRLRELVTGAELLCHSASGYGGRKKELWYVRLVPPLSDEFDYHLTMTTPYVLTDASAEDWTAFLNKHLLDASDKFRALYDLLKYGNERVDWMEFVFQAYHHAKYDAVFLAGIPDVRASLPHLRLHQEPEEQDAANKTRGDEIAAREVQRSPTQGHRPVVAGFGAATQAR